MSRLHTYLAVLVSAGTTSLRADADGYLLQGPPAALRLAQALIPPPPVNELILALSKPPATSEVAATNDVPAAMADTEPPLHLQPAIEELISKPADIGTVVDTASPTVASQPVPDPLPVPEVSPAAAASPDAVDQLGEILFLFNGNRRGNGRADSAVVVAPPTFLPPQSTQPAPSSRAVYRSQ